MGTYTGQDKRLQYLFQNGGGGGGGGGTNVEANPQGTPTDFLSTIKIGSSIYDVGKIGEIYSTEERQVGVWINGKPLYQRTYSGSWTVNLNGAWINTGINISGVEFLVDGWCGASTYKNNFSVLKNGSNLNITSIYNSGGTLTVTQITIQYTKTTDTAGSGIFVPSGAYAEHYTENEEIIGTWIDGKPLYRRTITGLSIPMNADNWVYYEGISVIDNLVNLHAYYNGTNGLLTCAIAEYQRSTNHGVMMSGISSAFNRTINAITIEYTKTTD